MADPSSTQPTSNGYTETTRNVKPYNLSDTAASGTNGTNGTTNSSRPPSSPPTSASDTEDTVTSPSSITSPPYWVHSHSRSISNVSVESMMGGITLLDNTNEGEGGDAKSARSGNASACWAKHVYIEDHTVINGSRTGIGAFVVWNVTVETLYGSPIHLRKRYSEFDELKEKLLQTFPRSTLPELPRKSLTAKFRPKFLEERREGLQYFLNSVLLNPEFAGSPVLKEFVFN